ncbi:MAG: hypothetical protein WA771_16395 [Chthoniobacterales bacterium]
MKSAYEIAMSRLEASEPTTKLTDEQRTEIAEIDNLYRAKVAERRVFLEGEIAKATGQPAETEMLQRQLTSEIARLEEEAEAKKDRVRQATSQ